MADDPNEIRDGEPTDDWLHRLRRQADKACAETRRRRRKAQKRAHRRRT